MTKEEILEELKKCDSSEEKELIDLYIKNSYYGEIIDKIINFDLDKRIRIFKNIFLDFEYINNQETLINYHNLYRESGFVFDYDLIKKIDNPKDNLNSKYISEMLDKKDSETLVKDYGNYFEDEILKKDDFYCLLMIKDLLKKETVNIIYERINDYKKYLKLKKYLEYDYDELVSYGKVFTQKGYTDAKIAYDILVNKWYTEENIDYLITVFVSNSTALQLYNVLMTNNFEGEYKEILEKALYDTGNIEYIAYYYFYRNKEKFILLFGSSTLFLVYVLNNKEKFTSTILKDVLNKIKEETKEVSDKVNKLVLKNVNK